MTLNFSMRLRCLWYQLRLNPFFCPSLAGCAVLTALLPWLGLSLWYGLVLLWAAFWALLEHMAPKGWPPATVRQLTPNFYAVRDLSGCWRVFQRPSNAGSCREALRDLLQDQTRLPAALKPGRYRTLTHDVILTRLQTVAQVTNLSFTPAYMATLDDIISRANRRRCKDCSDCCPFRTKHQARMFYDVRWEIS